MCHMNKYIYLLFLLYVGELAFFTNANIDDSESSYIWLITTLWYGMGSANVHLFDVETYLLTFSSWGTHRFEADGGWRWDIIM